MSLLSLHGDLRAAVRTLLGQTAGLPAAVAWEGRPFSPVLGQPFLSEQLRPIAAERRTVGAEGGGTTLHTVTANLTLRFPNGRGTKAVEDASGVLLHAFRPGRRLVHGAAAGIVVRAEPLPLQQESDWLSQAVVATIHAWTAS